MKRGLLDPAPFAKGAGEFRKVLIAGDGNFTVLYQSPAVSLLRFWSAQEMKSAQPARKLVAKR